MNLIPLEPGKGPSYWCTFGTQRGAGSQRDNLNEELLFGPAGWLSSFDKVRRDLYVVLDDGWDVACGKDPASNPEDIREFGSCEVCPDRFPSCTGTPAERLKKLNDKVRTAGWRGAGLWVAAQAKGEDGRDSMLGPEALAKYWAERAEWCDQAGIEYWKVDWGVRAHSMDFRQMLTQTAREVAPDLFVEHAFCMGPFNDPDGSIGRFRNWGNFLERNLRTLGQTDILRTYDVAYELGVATTMDRVAELLRRAEVDEHYLGLLNVEEELYLGAALGFPLGIQRHPAWRQRWPKEAATNVYIDRTRRGERIDEAVRAVRWQRLAPPFGIGESYAIVDGHVLHDSFEFGEELAWSGVANRVIVQGAPAMIARGIDLPELTTFEDGPFVVASKHPTTGAIAVATLPRTIGSQLPDIPAADLAIDIGEADRPLAIFGVYRSLALQMSPPLGPRRIWAQDLAGDQAQDITDKTQRSTAGEVVLPGELIQQIGTSAGTPGDVSYPGMVLMIR